MARCDSKTQSTHLYRKIALYGVVIPFILAITLYYLAAPLLGSHYSISARNILGGGFIFYLLFLVIGIFLLRVRAEFKRMKSRR